MRTTERDPRSVSIGESPSQARERLEGEREIRERLEGERD